MSTTFFGKFYHSAQQESACREIGYLEMNTARLLDGRIVAYTEMALREFRSAEEYANFEPCGTWADYEYLGEGYVETIGSCAVLTPSELLGILR